MSYVLCTSWLWPDTILDSVYVYVCDIFLWFSLKWVLLFFLRPRTIEDLSWHQTASYYFPTIWYCARSLTSLSLKKNNRVYIVLFNMIHIKVSHSWHGKRDTLAICYSFLRVSWVPQWSRFCLPCRGHRFDSWVRKIPWRRKQHPTLVFLPGESQRERGPGALQSMGSQRVGQDIDTKQHLWLLKEGGSS